MRVNPSNSPAVHNAETSSAKKSEKLKQTAYESKAEGASVSKKTESANAEISSKAREMATAKQIANDSPDVREAKIAELREKIQNKKYNVSASDIADRMVDDHLSMKGA
jgi:negative regulator of flagellin synthesis FlgM